MRGFEKAKNDMEIILEKSKNHMSMPKDLLNNYEIGDVVGEGHYAVVHECKDVNTGLVFALKIIDLKKCGNKVKLNARILFCFGLANKYFKKENMIENELDILRKVKHPNIIKLIEEYKSDDYVYLIMEFLKVIKSNINSTSSFNNNAFVLKAGDLLEDLTSNSKYDETEASMMISNLTSAVAYLHSNNIVHRDIKLENILVNK